MTRARLVAGAGLVLALTLAGCAVAPTIPPSPSPPPLPSPSPSPPSTAPASRQQAIERQHAARGSLSARLADGGFRRGQAVFIRILKQEGVLELWMRQPHGWRRFETYRICTFSGRLGPKLREGDRQAPEGFYLVGRSQLNPNSANHLAFNLGFPNAYDAALGRTGSALMVHGGCRSVGCYAMTDGQVDDIYRLVEAALAAGQPAVPVHAFPFRMTEANLARHARDPSAPFWANLAEGWRRFETTGALPLVYACGRRYGFKAAPGCTPIRPWA